MPTPAITLRALDCGLPRSGQWRNGFSLADVNGDGHLDLVHPPPRKSGRAPAIFLGDGRGQLQRTTGWRWPALPYDYGDAVAADLDRDGRVDLAFAIHLRGIVALRNQGDGELADWSVGLPLGAAGKAFSSRALAVADWDGDGLLDLVAVGEGPNRLGVGHGVSSGLRVFRNGGTVWDSVAMPEPDPAFGDSLAVGDVDGDGRVDAVTATGGTSGKAILHLNTGLGWRNVEVSELRARALVGAVAVGDLDGDRRADVLVGYQDPEGGVWHAGVDALLGRDGGFERRELLREDGKNPVKALALADLDGDRRLEVLVLRGDGTLAILAASGTQVTRLPAPEWRRGCAGYEIQLGDLDGDGRPEIVASFAGEASAFDLEAGCPSGGGLEAWAVELGKR